MTDHPSVQVFNGLRVRMGLHVGVPEGASSVNKASGRVVYSGHCIMIAKAVADAGAGG